MFEVIRSEGCGCVWVSVRGSVWMGVVGCVSVEVGVVWCWWLWVDVGWCG